MGLKSLWDLFPIYCVLIPHFMETGNGLEKESGDEDHFWGVTISVLIHRNGLMGSGRIIFQIKTGQNNYSKMPLFPLLGADISIQIRAKYQVIRTYFSQLRQLYLMKSRLYGFKTLIMKPQKWLSSPDSFSKPFPVSRKYQIKTQ